MAISALTCAARGDTFKAFPDNSTHISVAVVAAADDVPAGAGAVYNAGNPNDIQIVNFGTVIYTGAVNVATTIQRLQNNQSVYADESDDGGFFNFNSGELPNIPRMGMNYYMEFMVWPTMNLAANTFDTTATPYNSGDTFPGPERILVGSAGEVYFTGDHYSTSDNVSPVTQPAALNINSWTAVSSTWSTAGNWSSSHVPIAGELAYLSVEDEKTRTVTYDYTGAAVMLADLLVNADGTSTSHGSMTFSQAQGVLTVSKEEIWARYASAAVIQSGGTDTIQGPLHIGSLVASVGTYTLSNGSLTATDEYIGSTELVASAGTGTFTQSGGIHTVTDALHLGFAAGGTGTYSLQGGTLNAATIDLNLGGAFTQTTGTLTFTNFNQVAGTFSAPTLQLISTATLITTGGTDTFSSISNAGSISLVGSSLTVTGAATNSGDFFDSATQSWAQGSTFTNTAGSAVFNTDVGSAASSTLAMSAKGGTVTLNSNQHLASLSITAPGQIDMTNTQLFVSSTAPATIRSYLSAGYDQGKWDLPGLMSSSAASHAGTSLGYAPLSSGTEVKYTWIGDANLDGVVNSADLAAISPTGTTWYTGDFNYDGKVNADDYALFMLGSLYGTANISTTLPEPAVLYPCLGFLLATLPRRLGRE
ncbi:MAG TPA: ribonuclease domain-containing protein [Tepidisphaeraceae bacterium]|jgi:hypothetical protein